MAGRGLGGVCELDSLLFYRNACDTLQLPDVIQFIFGILFISGKREPKLDCIFGGTIPGWLACSRKIKGKNRGNDSKQRAIHLYRRDRDCGVLLGDLRVCCFEWFLIIIL